MIKQQFIQALASTTSLSVSQATEAVDTLITVASSALMRGEDIQLRGFGSLHVITRRAKLVRHINHGQSYVYPEHRTVKFIPAHRVKKALQQP